jgi:enterochelin esterase-like enzyme
MRKLFWLLSATLFMFIATSTSANTFVGVPVCPSQEVICRVEIAWTLADLRAEIGNLKAGEGQFFSHEDLLTFVYRLSHSRYERAAALLMDEVPMQQVEASDWWTVTLKFEQIDRALLTIGVVEYRTGETRYEYPAATWRGENAPLPPQKNQPLEGSLTRIPFESASLGESRDVFVYLPPHHDSAQRYPIIYLADGEMLANYADAVDYLITRAEIAPVVIIGIASAEPRDNRNLRGEEYVHGRNPQRYEQHRVFFTQEVRQWAEASYGASTERAERVIAGISNGGLFAVAMTLHHPELYGTAFPFSAGASLGFEPLRIEPDTIQLPLRIYATAGTLEPIFHQTTLEFVQAYEQAGAETIFSENIAAHDGAMWEVEFINALRWRF